MTSYIAMESDRAPGEGVRLVPDRFVLIALVAPLLWLLWHRLWLEAILLLCAGLALGALSAIPGMEWLAVTLALLLGLLVSLEGGALRVASLRRKGWREAGVVAAGSREEAEIRYFSLREGLVPQPSPAAPAQRTLLPAATSRQNNDGMLGMLDYPGAR